MGIEPIDYLNLSLGFSINRNIAKHIFVFGELRYGVTPFNLEFKSHGPSLLLGVRFGKKFFQYVGVSNRILFNFKRKMETPPVHPYLALSIYFPAIEAGLGYVFFNHLQLKLSASYSYFTIEHRLSYLKRRNYEHINYSALGLGICVGYKF